MDLKKISQEFVMKFDEVLQIVNEEYKFGEECGIRFFYKI